MYEELYKHFAYIDGLVQDFGNSSAWALELLQFYTEPLITSWHEHIFCINGPLCRESTSPRRIPFLNEDHASLLLAWMSCWTVQLPMICNAITLKNDITLGIITMMSYDRHGIQDKRPVGLYSPLLIQIIQYCNKCLHVDASKTGWTPNKKDNQRYTFNAVCPTYSLTVLSKRPFSLKQEARQPN